MAARKRKAPPGFRPGTSCFSSGRRPRPPATVRPVSPANIKPTLLGSGGGAAGKTPCVASAWSDEHPIRLRPLQGPSNRSSMSCPARDSQRREPIGRSAESGMHAFISPQPEVTGITHHRVVHNQYGCKKKRINITLALIYRPLESPRRLRRPASCLSTP